MAAGVIGPMTAEIMRSRLGKVKTQAGDSRSGAGQEKGSSLEC
jgi:hypothetical protein